MHDSFYYTRRIVMKYIVWFRNDGKRLIFYFFFTFRRMNRECFPSVSRTIIYVLRVGSPFRVGLGPRVIGNLRFLNM